MLIFSIFESKWGSGRKYLKNGGRASPSPSEGGDVPGGVRLGVVVCSGKYWRTSYFSLLIVCFYEGMNHKKR